MEDEDDDEEESVPLEEEEADDDDDDLLVLVSLSFRRPVRVWLGPRSRLPPPLPRA